MRLATALVMLACIACGDNTRVARPYEAVSGTRLKLSYYLYEDGTRQWDAEAFFDVRLHARCTPRTWSDGVVRCVPDADDAVYVDDQCTQVIGRASTISKPTHFIGYDRVGAEVVPARAYRAGAKATAIAQYYERQDGECRGPFVNTLEDVQHYEPRGELEGADLVALEESELGEARLGLRIRMTEDGLRVPLGLHDRELELACRPAGQADGSFACEPVASTSADHFRDHACTDPAVAVAEGEPAPALASVTGAGSCGPSYHAVGDEVAPPIYRREGEACVREVLTSPLRWFALGAAVELPALERTIEQVAGRRLQRIIVHDDELRVVDDRLFDTATRADCRRAELGEVARCIPVATAAATTLYAEGCGVEVRVAELADRPCEQPTFAAASTEAGLDLHVIGGPHGAPLYHHDLAGQCVRYASPEGVVPHTLGPPIPPDAFVAAVAISDR